jgi:hypothetical protein
MGVHLHVLERLFDQRHVAGDALTTRSVRLVVLFAVRIMT